MTAATLAKHTTLRLGGPAREFVLAVHESQLVDTVARADEAGTPVLLLSGGSNLVVSDDGFPGTAVHIRTRGVDVDRDADGATVTVAAGENWDELVARAVTQGWVGIEALSGIPGSVGATPVQNVGAYGQEVSQTITSVRLWDRAASTIRTIEAGDCGFGYRTSRFKKDPATHVVLAVTFRFGCGDVGGPVRYAELAHSLGVEPGGQAPLRQVRDAVLKLRRKKGMVLDDADHDTWSTGSFFTNPFLPANVAGRLAVDAPRWDQPDGTTKIGAAWLIEHSGFARGYGNDRVSLSTKHTLALTNRGGATTKDLVALAAEIQAGVLDAFGVWLDNEPVLVGCELPRP